MKALRHRLGRWLLRDDGHTRPVRMVFQTSPGVLMEGEHLARTIQTELLKLKRRNGGSSLGLS